LFVTQLLKESIETFLTERGFYDTSIEEIETLMGPIAFQAFNKLELARLEAELLLADDD
jgi:hypothetical protein